MSNMTGICENGPWAFVDKSVYEAFAAPELRSPLIKFTHAPRLM